MSRFLPAQSTPSTASLILRAVSPATLLLLQQLRVIAESPSHVKPGMLVISVRNEYSPHKEHGSGR